MTTTATGDGRLSPTKGTPLVAFRLRPPELRVALEAEARANGETLTDLINRVLAAHVEAQSQE